MPTKQELEDLCEKCDWSWTSVNGVNGYSVCGRGAYASARIFLPAAGVGDGTSLNGSGSRGDYWSSLASRLSAVPGSDYSRGAYVLYFSSGYHSTGSNPYRSYGQSVRPVQGFTK